MSATVSPTAAYVDLTGIHAPSYQDIVSYLTGAFQAIYGADIVVDPSSQDGQLIGVFALAIHDTNSAAIAVYNGFSPSTAQGIGLSSMVKINGLQREVSTYSTVPLTLIGEAYRVITNGIAQDLSGQRWLLPASVEIPFGGEITVTGTADAPGAITALPGTIVNIATVTRGWQKVNNPAAAIPGAPVESDSALRQRQSTSTADPSETVLMGIRGAVMALPDVTAAKIYENDTSTDYTATTPPIGVDPLPPHSISLVVQGGDPTAICQTILLHKTPGCYTYGSERRTVNDGYGLPHDIGYFIPTPLPVGVRISLTAKAGYSSIIGAQISEAVAAYIKALGSGEDVVWSKLWLPANLCDWTTGVPTNATGTYDITSLTVSSLPEAGDINTTFEIVPTTAMTADTGDVTTATTITSGAPLLVTSISSDNTGLVNLSTVITLPTNVPVTLGSAITMSWSPTPGNYVATMTVTTRTPGANAMTIIATGTVTGSGTPLNPSPISLTIGYTQSGGAGTAINALFNVTPGAYLQTNIPIAITEMATCSPTDVIVTAT